MDETLDPQGRSMLERLGARSSPESTAPDSSIRDSFAGTRNREDEHMLDVRLKDGTRCALPYGTLTKVDFSPSGSLRLAFVGSTVVIEGRRLTTLYDLLRRHRAQFVQEGTLAEEGLKPDDATHIDHIHFENPEEDNR